MIYLALEKDAKQRRNKGERLIPTVSIFQSISLLSTLELVLVTGG